MRTIASVQRFFARRRILGLLMTSFSVFLGCSSCYLAGAYFENGNEVALKVCFLLLAVCFCAVSLFQQTIFWCSGHGGRFGPLRVGTHVQIITIDMVALLLCFAVFGPIGFSLPKSFIATSRLAPGAFIFLFLLVSAIPLAAIRIAAFSHSNSRVGTNNTAVKCSSIPWFLLVYFLLLVVPYSFTPVPAINAFFTGAGKIPYRFLTTSLLGGYSLYLWIRFRLKPRFDLLIPMSFLWLSFALACSFAPRSFIYVAEGLNGSFHFVGSSYSLSIVWIQLPLLVADCFVLFCFVSFFPPCIHSRKDLLIPLVGISMYVLAACLYSYVSEFRSYVNYINGSDQSKGAIQSWTQSKNAFGILLFHGAFVSGFLFYYIKKWWKYLFAFFALVLLATSYVAQCYSAMVPILAICLVLSGIIIRSSFRKNKILGASLLILCVVLVGALSLCVFVPVIYESTPFLTKLNRKVFYFLDHEIITRTKKWDLSLIVCKGPFAFIGKSSMAEIEVSMRESADLQMPYPDFHSSFVSMFATSGLVGLLMYVYTIGIVMKNIWSVLRNKALLLVLCGLLFACILFSMPETYTLFLSMSVITLPFTYLFIVFLPYLRRSEA